MHHKEKKKNRFFVFMLLYSAVILVIGAAGLFFLSQFLKEYEQALPKHELERYTNELIHGNIQAEEFPVLNKTDQTIQTHEESLAFIYDKLSRAKLFRAVNECTDNLNVYTIKADDAIIGRAEMVSSGETKHGFKTWKFTNTEFYFDQFLCKDSIVVPEDFRVEVNGKLLTREHIVEKSIPYEYLSPFYSDYPSLPTMVKYETGQIFGSPEFSVYNSGNRLLQKDEVNETVFLNSLFPSEKENELRSFSEDFVERYVSYSSNAGGASAYLYSRMKELAVPESKLHNRLRMAFDSLYYINCQSADIHDLVIEVVCSPAPGISFVKLNYTTDIRANSEETITDNSIGLIVVDFNSYELRSETMTTY